LSKDLDREIKSLLADGIDPISADGGVWFDFVRTKTGHRDQDVEDRVSAVQEYVDVGGGKKAKVYKEAPLTEGQREQAVQDCPDLAKMFTALTHEQVAMLVASSGDPAEVDQIFAMAQANKEASASASRRVAVAPAPTPKPAPAPAPKPAPAPAAPAAAPGVDLATLMAQVAALQAQIAAAKTPAAPAAKPAKDTSNNDEFDEIFS
jgi:hypothetical protein